MRKAKLRNHLKLHALHYANELLVRIKNNKKLSKTVSVIIEHCLRNSRIHVLQIKNITFHPKVSGILDEFNNNFRTDTNAWYIIDHFVVF